MYVFIRVCKFMRMPAPVRKSECACICVCMYFPGVLACMHAYACSVRTRALKYACPHARV